jgi:hypothetical protein
MPFNTLLLPLLGGYLFLTNWNVTRYSTQRHSGERLLFHSAFAGAVLLAISFVLVAVASRTTPEINRWWRNAVPFPYSGTSAVALLLGAFAWLPLNLLYPREEAVRNAIQDANDHLEMLLDKAIRNTFQIALTTTSRKIYIGFVTGTFDPTFERKYITILPTMSGYRAEDDLRYNLTTNYADVYDRIAREHNTKLLARSQDFEIVLPVSEIRSANIFDPEAYKLFVLPEHRQQQLELGGALDGDGSTPDPDPEPRS